MHRYRVEFTSKSLDESHLRNEAESVRAIAERLVITRLALGFNSQKEFLTAIGMSRQGWHFYEGARKRIPLDTALQLCRQFKLSLDWIYRGELNGLPDQLVQNIEKAKARRSRFPIPRPDGGELIELRLASEVIDVLGGTHATAQFLERQDQAVSNWRRANRFAATTYLIITKELGRLRYRAPPSLWGMIDPEGGASG